MDVSINPWAVLAAAAATFVIGGVWYSLLFAKPWQKAAGVSDEQLASGRLRTFGGSAVLALIMALALAAFLGRNGALFGLITGAITGIAWVSAAFGTNYLFERRPLALFAINAGYNVVTFAAMGLLIGLIQA